MQQEHLYSYQRSVLQKSGLLLDVESLDSVVFLLKLDEPDIHPHPEQMQSTL